ncbi:MAG: DUF126 domain-containing protein [Candidatus Korarchaeota archaeon]|nr:DUF126 domain-containing protein [Candidatus Korarchaeota archaeon]NIU85451.1 DUF126 domain-containing protein [Candidatus Thorarchaeota archaeon]NIW15563.1 DUF126 domain-containing protein [Candidatus Thorarchaeota archaeon]NIW53504.1 DUF126 domain-containing protein [Candidatus Korarchaeota archaeon]
MTKRIEGRVIVSWEEPLTGRVIKYTKKVSFLGDIDPSTGKAIRTLDKKQRKIANKILFFPGSKGSTVGSAVLYGLAKRGKAPKLIVTPKPDLVTMGGTIFGEIPTLKISTDSFELVDDGEQARAYVKGNKGIIEVGG